VGPWLSVASFPQWLETPFTFSIDGKTRQEGRATEMVLSPAECIAHARSFFPLCEGDLLYTGTPAGVGPVTAGQTARLRWGALDYSVTWSA
jgi:2-keto-4-pentenoate hydratase/2-oxohepta-3-ene-1,7-dioic acid hydratase in catechol pathway